MGRESNAVVLGAGMAGLITARVLSEAYDTVTVVDRDPLPDAAVPRRGVPIRWPARPHRIPHGSNIAVSQQSQRRCAMGGRAGTMRRCG
jgi:glycine/D-amino acid oxidase-like deaminating enzyme